MFAFSFTVGAHTWKTHFLQIFCQPQLDPFTARILPQWHTVLTSARKHPPGTILSCPTPPHRRRRSSSLSSPSRRNSQSRSFDITTINRCAALAVGTKPNLYSFDANQLRLSWSPGPGLDYSCCIVVLYERQIFFCRCTRGKHLLPEYTVRSRPLLVHVYSCCPSPTGSPASDDNANNDNDDDIFQLSAALLASIRFYPKHIVC